AKAETAGGIYSTGRARTMSTCPRRAPAKRHQTVIKASWQVRANPDGRICRPSLTRRLPAQALRKGGVVERGRGGHLPVLEFEQVEDVRLTFPSVEGAEAAAPMDDRARRVDHPAVFLESD